MEEICTQLKNKYPNITIILSELPPRKLQRDAEVLEVNRLLQLFCSKYDHVHLIEQANLRNETYSMMYDDKHIHKRFVHLYAGNIKRALRKAYGRPEPNHT